MLATIQHIVSLIPGGLPAGIALGVEIILRIIPSDKPKSLLLAAAAVGHALSSGIEKLSDLIDEAIPQSLTK